MTFRTFTNNSTIKKLCKKLIDCKMYVDGWTMYDWYVTPHKVKSITIAYYNRRIVGVFVTRTTSYHPCYHLNSGFFVKPEFRRKNIGSMLIAANRASRNMKNFSYYVDEGIDGSITFLDKCTNQDNSKINFA